MSLLVYLLLLMLSKFNFSQNLNVCIIRCRKPSDLDLAENDFKKITSFFRVKSKQINSELVEMIFEYKLHKGINLTDLLPDKKYIKDFQILSNN